jgi:hypothetical protein
MKVYIDPLMGNDGFLVEVGDKWFWITENAIGRTKLTKGIFELKEATGVPIWALNACLVINDFDHKMHPIGMDAVDFPESWMED